MNKPANHSVLEQETQHLTPREQDSFLKNIFQTGKIDSAFLYSGSSELYKQAVHSEAYLPYHAELELLEKNRPQLQQHLGSYLTDYGSGNGEKAEAVLQTFGKKISYLSADYSYAMIEAAKKRLGQLPLVETGQHILLDGNDFTLGKELENNTYLRLGETMSNYSDWEIIEKFKNMGNKDWRKGNKIIFSFALRPDTEEAIQKRIKSYDNPDGETFRMEGLQHLGLKKSDFEDVVKYDKSSGLIQTGIKAKKSQEIRLSNGEKIQILGGKFYPFHQNRAFSKEEVEQLLKQAKCRSLFFAEKDGVGLMVARKAPEKREKYKNKVAKALVGVLLVGAGMGIKPGLDVKKQHQEFARVQKELVKGKTLDQYGWNTGNRADFGNAQEELAKRTHTLSERLYQDLGQIFDLSLVQEKERVLLIIQSQLLRQQNDGSSINLKSLETQQSKEKSDFLSAFVREFRVILGSYGAIDRVGSYQNAFSPTQNLSGELKGYYARGSTNTDGFFKAHEENTTPFKDLVFPFLGEKWSSPSHLEAKEKFERSKSIFEIKNTGNGFVSYRCADGKCYQLLLVNKEEKLPSGELLKGPFLLAAESAEKSYGGAKCYSLSLGKKVIADYLERWASAGS